VGRLGTTGKLRGSRAVALVVDAGRREAVCTLVALGNVGAGRQGGFLLAVAVAAVTVGREAVGAVAVGGRCAGGLRDGLRAVALRVLTADFVAAVATRALRDVGAALLGLGDDLGALTLLVFSLRRLAVRAVAVLRCRAGGPRFGDRLGAVADAVAAGRLLTGLAVTVGFGVALLLDRDGLGVGCTVVLAASGNEQCNHDQNTHSHILHDTVLPFEGLFG